LAAAPAAKVLKVSVEADVFDRSPTLHHPIIFGNVRDREASLGVHRRLTCPHKH
jgi:hypothetical protein